MGQLRLVLHITKAADGGLTATLDSVDQNANGIPVKSATLKNSKLNLDVEAVHGTYDGTVRFLTEKPSAAHGSKASRSLWISSGLRPL